MGVLFEDDFLDGFGTCRSPTFPMAVLISASSLRSAGKSGAAMRTRTPTPGSRRGTAPSPRRKRRQRVDTSKAPGNSIPRLLAAFDRQTRAPDAGLALNDPPIRRQTIAF